VVSFIYLFVSSAVVQNCCFNFIKYGALLSETHKNVTVIF